MSKFLRLFSPFVLAFIFVSGICGLVYGAVQQDLRQTANDPQIQLAENSAASLATATNIDVGTEKIDLVKSLSPFIIIVDKDNKVLASNAVMNGQTPVPPAGVFASAARSGENRVTWQPAPGVRIALVVVPVGNDKGQFVAVGRSLREVEKRENQIFMLSAIAWLILLAVSFIGIFLSQDKKENEITSPEV